MDSRSRLEQLRRFCEIRMSSEDKSATIADLRTRLAEWRESGQMPPGTGALPSGHYKALSIASDNERLLESPVAAFLLLDDWLQDFVMEERGWRAFIGSRIGSLPKQ